VSGACGNAAGVVVGRRAAEAEAEGLQRGDQGEGGAGRRGHIATVTRSRKRKNNWSSKAPTPSQAISQSGLIIKELKKELSPFIFRTQKGQDCAI
jgi:hypothetical protein